MPDIERGTDTIGLMQMAGQQKPIPKWEDAKRPQILLMLAVSFCLLFVGAVIYTRMCPCFGGLKPHVKALLTKQP